MVAEFSEVSCGGAAGMIRRMNSAITLGKHASYSSSEFLVKAERHALCGAPPEGLASKNLSAEP